MLAVETRRSGPAARFPVRELVGALVGGDEAEAMEVTERTLRATGSRTAVFADLLHPAQVEIANLWYAGRVGSADEVRAAGLVRRIVNGLPPTPAARTVPAGSRCVLAVPPGDPHDVGLLMLTLALQDHGWRTEVMGAVRSLCEVADMVVARRPRVFGLSAGDLPPVPHLERALSAICRAGVPVLVGGAAFARRPDLWHRLGASGLGTDVRVGVVLANRFARR
jgi:MerR family transcriptional regulator, light-induced transcriptional regulator